MDFFFHGWFSRPGSETRMVSQKTKSFIPSLFIINNKYLLKS